MTGQRSIDAPHAVRLLVIDDDPSLIEELEEIATLEGFELAILRAGETVAEAVRKFGPDVVLTDVLMSGVNGFDVCREIKSTPDLQLIPVVILTALDSRADRVRGIEAGCDDFISKPFNRLELTARVRSLARVKRLNDDLVASVEHLNAEIAQRIQAQEQLRANLEELDQFARAVAHDLKAPLAAITRLSGWLYEDAAPNLEPTSRDHLDLLQRASGRLTGMIDGILAYARLGRERIPVKRVRTGTVVAQVLEMLVVPPDFEVIVAPAMPTVFGFPALLHQVFSNLLSNAIKYRAGDGGRVEVGWNDLEQSVEFAVSDDGIGIAHEQQRRVFEPFVKLESRDKVEGTGLGLSLVKKIIKGQGGAIRLESAPGRGTTFRFTWPKRARSPANPVALPGA